MKKQEELTAIRDLIGAILLRQQEIYRTMFIGDDSAQEFADNWDDFAKLTRMITHQQQSKG